MPSEKLLLAYPSLKRRKPKRQGSNALQFPLSYDTFLPTFLHAFSLFLPFSSFFGKKTLFSLNWKANVDFFSGKISLFFRYRSRALEFLA
jgi:hypothetical protein